MQTALRVAVTAFALCLASVLVAEQSNAVAPATKASATTSSAAGISFRLAATVKDIMDLIIDPAGDAVFDAVSTTLTPTSTEEKAPNSEEEWTTVRHNALLVIEGANLLMMPGRHIASGSERPRAVKPRNSKEPEIELDPAQIEARVAKDRSKWVAFARKLSAAGAQALKAADARNPEALLAAGEALDTACENCHLYYWYPSQTELLNQAEKLLRGAAKP
jgi:hypothetical protein